MSGATPPLARNARLWWLHVVNNATTHVTSCRDWASVVLLRSGSGESQASLTTAPSTPRDPHSTASAGGFKLDRLGRCSSVEKWIEVGCNCVRPWRMEIVSLAELSPRRRLSVAAGWVRLRAQRPSHYLEHGTSCGTAVGANPFEYRTLLDHQAARCRCCGRWTPA